MVARETSIAEALAELGLDASPETARQLADFTEILLDEALPAGYIGPGEGPRILPRHIIESAALAPWLEPATSVADVGSGAGLPGLVLAILGHQITLIEAQLRRASFLRRVVSRLGLTSAEVLHKRGEDVGRGRRRETFDAVCARALAPPAVAFELCLPLVRPGGVLLILTEPAGRPTAGSEQAPASRGSWPLGSAGEWTDDSGEEARGEARPRRPAKPPEGTPSGGLPTGAGTASAPPVRAAAPGGASPGRHRSGAFGSAARRSGSASAPPSVEDAWVRVAGELGGAAPVWVERPVPGVDLPRWVMMVEKIRATPERYPRRAGVPQRRPLG